MATISLQKAQAELGDLLIRAEAGEEIVIERGDLPALRLVVTPKPTDGTDRHSDAPAACEPSGTPVRGYGSFAHLKGKIPDSFFFDPLPEEELKLWEGGD